MCVKNIISRLVVVRA